MQYTRICRWAALTTGLLLSASVSGYCGQLNTFELAVAGVSVVLFLLDGLNTTQ